MCVFWLDSTGRVDMNLTGPGSSESPIWFLLSVAFGTGRYRELPSPEYRQLTPGSSIAYPRQEVWKATASSLALEPVLTVTCDSLLTWRSNFRVLIRRRISGRLRM